MKKQKGTTLVELMIVVSILGVFMIVAPNLYKQTRRFFFLSNTRIEIQRNARGVMDTMTRRLRQGISSTVVIDQYPGQPVYSRITFTDIDNHVNCYYQSGKNLKMQVGTSTTTLTTDVRYLAFALPRSDDMGIVSVSLTLEKSIYEGQTKALHMASEKVRVMN